MNQRIAKEIIPATTAWLRNTTPEKNPHFARSDIGNGRLFADWCRNMDRYAPERKKWYVYNGKIWEPDPRELGVMELCKVLADSLLIYAMSLEGETKESYMEFVTKWQMRRYRETIVKDAASVHPVKVADFDKDPMLFNCKNGTLDLRDFTFRAHLPSDLLTVISGVKFDASAPWDNWAKFISEVMQGDAEKATYLQKAMGYGLTGEAEQECFFNLFGPTTRNGKDTTIVPYMKMLGGYGRTTGPETITQKMHFDGSAPNEDIARLAGARVVSISEPDKRMVLSAATVKTLTGGGIVRARFLNENSFEFTPQFKLFINTNHLPKITDVTVFTSDRVKVIPFERHFTPAEQDKALKKKLSSEKSLSGLLNWCLYGLKIMRVCGFEPPASVVAAVEKYRRDSDKIARFVDEMMEPDINGEIRTEEAYQSYQAWCFRNGHYPEAMPNFKQSMEAHAIIKRKRPNGAGREATLNWFVCGMKWRCVQVCSPIL